jgi:ribonucleoside-triphosphate reductase (thioredoxin)
MTVSGTKLMSDAKFYEAYSRWVEEENRYETWGESVDRVMAMHSRKYSNKMTDELKEVFTKITEAYKNKQILGAQRALQFGGEQLEKNNLRLYNCSSGYLDRPNAFGEMMELLLSGCGVGFSVQWHHVNKLPFISQRTKEAKGFVISDSIEGWSEAVDVLMSSFFVGGGKHPEYEGHPIWFDLSQIRPRGAKISGGFKAPGPEPLRKALDKMETILTNVSKEERKLKPIEAYDICMHLADSVIAGGVRRSATICMFSKDDAEMMNAKTGDWYVSNPQRGRSNNSAVLIRNETTFEEYAKLMESVKHSGEPGLLWMDSTEFTFNPCVN